MTSKYRAIHAALSADAKASAALTEEQIQAAAREAIAEGIIGVDPLAELTHLNQELQPEHYGLHDSMQKALASKVIASGVPICPEQNSECGTDPAKWCMSCRELLRYRALVTELRANASAWHRLVESFATIMDLDSSGSAEQLGVAISERIRAHQALVTELRALAERMEEYDTYASGDEAKGIDAATEMWRSEIVSLLSAHGSKPEQETAAQPSRNPGELK